MPITTILFDLDGTLLPMDQDPFAKAYVMGLAGTAAAAGYDPRQIAAAVMAGTEAMVKNDGSKSNEDAFWETLEGVCGRPVKKDIRIFDAYYAGDFQKIRSVCGFIPGAAELIACLKERGYRLVLATNPLFPRIATENRIRWAGLRYADFDHVTTYENSTYCKPNPAYYREILDRLGLSPEECLMVGNDSCEDMAAATLGMKVFLLTDCLLNGTGADISAYPHGGWEALVEHLARLEK